MVFVKRKTVGFNVGEGGGLVVIGLGNSLNLHVIKPTCKILKTRQPGSSMIAKCIHFGYGESVRSWCDGSSDQSFMGWTH